MTKSLENPLHINPLDAKFLSGKLFIYLHFISFLYSIMALKSSLMEDKDLFILYISWQLMTRSLQWRHNGRNGISNHQPRDCLLSIYSGTDKKTSKLRVTGLCSGNTPVTSEFPAQIACNRKMFPFDYVIMAMQGARSSAAMVLT